MKRWSAGMVVGFWLLWFATIVQAQTFFEIVLGADYRSIGFAAGAAMFASFVRTTVTMALPNIPVFDELRQSWRDLVFASAAGVVAYFGNELIKALWWPLLPPIVQMAIVLGAGALRLRFLNFFNHGFDRVSDAALDRAVNLVKGKPT